MQSKPENNKVEKEQTFSNVLVWGTYDVGKPRHGALLTVIDPEIRDSIELRGLDVAYSLSESEAAVAALIVDGMTTAEIAESRNVGLETIKTQVASLLRKTRSRNRTELVRRALMLNLPIE